MHTHGRALPHTNMLNTHKYILRIPTHTSFFYENNMRCAIANRKLGYVCAEVRITTVDLVE